MGVNKLILLVVIFILLTFLVHAETQCSIIEGYKTEEVFLENILNEDSSIDFAYTFGLMFPSVPKNTVGVYTTYQFNLPKEADIMNLRVIEEIRNIELTKVYELEQGNYKFMFDDTTNWIEIYLPPFKQARIKVMGKILPRINYTSFKKIQNETMEVINSFDLEFEGKDYSYPLYASNIGGDNVIMEVKDPKDICSGINTNLKFLPSSNGFSCVGEVIPNTQCGRFVISATLAGKNVRLIEEKRKEDDRNFQKWILKSQLVFAGITAFSTIFLVIATLFLALPSFFSNLRENDKQLFMNWLKIYPHFIGWVRKRMSKREEKRKQKEELKRKKEELRKNKLLEKQKQEGNQKQPNTKEFKSIRQEDLKKL